MKIFLNDIAGASYTFNKTAKTVTLTGLTTITIDKVLAIVNTTRGVTIFNPTSASTTGTISGNVITLAYDTTSQDNADNLMIVLDYSTGQTTMTKSMPVVTASDQKGGYSSETIIHNGFGQSITLTLVNPNGIVSGVVTTSSAHNLRAGDMVSFTSLTGASGGVAGRSNEFNAYQSGPVYFVLTTPTSTTFTYSTTPNGSATTGHNATTGTIRIGYGQLIDCRGYQTLNMFMFGQQLTWSGTISIESSQDGQTWTPTTGIWESYYNGFWKVQAQSNANFGGLALPTTVKVNVSGNNYVRFSLSAWSSGSVTIKGQLSQIGLPNDWSTTITSQGIALNTVVPAGNMYTDGSVGRSFTGYSNTDGGFTAMAVNPYIRSILNSTYVWERNPEIYKTVSTQATGNTAVWTPTSGKKFRILKFKVQITGEATLGGAATLVIGLQDATTDLNLTHSVYVPAVAPAAPNGVVFDSGWIDLGHLGKLSALANNVLNVNLSAALTAGYCRVIACGTEE